MNNKKIEGEFNGQKITLEVGRLAPQADSAVFARLGDTTVLVTIVSNPSTEDVDFFPLRVDYEEKFYAGGIIGGSRFTRREGRPNDAAIVSGRLIDHAIRPLFSKDFIDDTQIIVTVLSIDGENDPALLGFFAASAALSISGLPFSGSVVPLRIQKTEDGRLLFNLDEEDEGNNMDLIVTYLDNGGKIQAIEGCASIVPEEEVLDAIKKGAEKVQPLYKLLQEFISACGVPVREYTPSWLNREIIEEIYPLVLPHLEKWRKDEQPYKGEKWKNNLAVLANEIVERYEGKYTKGQIASIMAEVQKDFCRDLILNRGERMDRRRFDEIRPLSVEVGVLPRVHGSAIFNRGLTQCLTVATLASTSQKLLIQGMGDEETKRYMHHYNFPPFSVGEVGRIGSASRRSIGHGILAERALLPVLPSEEDFAYVIRLVSEILSSNGSTSMAAACGSSLALMDAGVPIRAHVGGIGVGLFVDTAKEDPQIKDYKILTDIVGYEDFAGYMDFKLAGTRDGATAIQMELKVKGIPIGLLDKVFETSKKARMEVLGVMERAIEQPRKEVSKYAPKLAFIKIEKGQIGQIIGTGGAVIKAIMEENNVEIDIEEREDYGIVTISSNSEENIKRAKEYIESLVAKVEVGDVYDGKVTRVEDYGAFVEILPRREALLHVSEFSYGYVQDMSSRVRVGDKLRVKVIGIENGKISVSKKALEQPPAGRSDSNDRGYLRSSGHGGRDRRYGGGRRTNGKRRKY